MAPDGEPCQQRLAVAVDRDGGFRYADLGGAEWDSIFHGSPVIEPVGSWIQEVGFPSAIEGFEAEGV